MFSSMLLAALILPSVTKDNADIDRYLHEERVRSALLIGQEATKEITVGCLATPIPTTPSGPTWVFEVNTGTNSSPEVVRGTFWRKPCSGANDAQLILTFVPLSGNPFVCSGSRTTLIQNAQQTDDFFFDTSPNTTSIDSVCGDLFVPTSVVIDERDNSFVFDDDAAFTFIYQGGVSSVPTATVNVGPYDPAAYGQSTQPLPITGKLSGSYYDPARNGEGVLVEIGRLGTRRTIFVTWYTYANGTQKWIAGNVDYVSGAREVQVPLITTMGGQFGSAFNPSQVQVSSFGTVTVSFPTCGSMTFQWSETGGQSGTYNYVRLVEGLEGVACP